MMKYFAYSQKEFIYKYVVMLSDIDQFKHMSFANYLKLMFLATDALIVGAPNCREFMQQYRLKTYQTHMQFKNQTVFGDNILIKVNASNVAGDRFNLLFTYVIEETAALVALGKLQLGFVDQKRSIRIPNDVVFVLEPIKVEEDNLVYKY